MTERQTNIIHSKSLVKIELPSAGKLNVRFRQMRCMWQVFVGNYYIAGASGDTPQDAIEELHRQYNNIEGRNITIH